MLKQLPIFDWKPWKGDEKIVLNKLDKYKEVANRDRFILPIENDIKLFTNEIDNAIKYFN